MRKLAVLSPKFGNAKNRMLSLTLALLMIVKEKNDSLLSFRCNLEDIFKNQVLLCLNTDK